MYMYINKKNCYASLFFLYIPYCESKCYIKKVSFFSGVNLFPEYNKICP